MNRKWLAILGINAIAVLFVSGVIVFNNQRNARIKNEEGGPETVYKVPEIKAVINSQAGFRIPSTPRLQRAAKNGTLRIFGCQCVQYVQNSDAEASNQLAFKVDISTEIGHVKRQIQLRDSDGPIEILDMELDQHAPFAVEEVKATGADTVMLILATNKPVKPSLSSATTPLKMSIMSDHMSEGKETITLSLQGKENGTVALVRCRDSESSYFLDVALTGGANGWQESTPQTSVILPGDFKHEESDLGLDTTKEENQSLTVKVYPPGLISSSIIPIGKTSKLGFDNLSKNKFGNSTVIVSVHSKAKGVVKWLLVKGLG